MFVDGAEPCHIDERTGEWKAGVADVVRENLKSFRGLAEITVCFTGRKCYIARHKDIAEPVTWQSLTCLNIVIVKSEDQFT